MTQRKTTKTTEVPSYAEIRPHYRGGFAVCDRVTGIQLLPERLQVFYGNRLQALVAARGLPAINPIDPEDLSTYELHDSSCSVCGGVDPACRAIQSGNEIDKLRASCNQAADEVASYRTMSADWQMAVLEAEELRAKINGLAQEFGRLATTANGKASLEEEGGYDEGLWEGTRRTWEKAAQMVATVGIRILGSDIRISATPGKENEGNGGFVVN